MKLQQVDPGFTTDNILTFRIDLNFSKYHGDAPAALCWRRVSERLRTVPGVTRVGGAGTFPAERAWRRSRSL